MNAKELAGQLNGREYGTELSHAEEVLASNDGLVVVYGLSDDNMELRWAIHDEVGCWDGGTAYLAETGVFEPCSEDEDCKYSEDAKEKCKTIEAIWATGTHTWTYETDIPHETFEILEDGDKWCLGIVFHISSLKQ